MFKVTIRGLVHARVRVIVGPLRYDELCNSITSGGWFAEAVDTLLDCAPGQVSVTDIAIRPRNAPEIAFTNQTEMGFVLGSIQVGERYEGMNVYSVEARLEKKK